ncbi:MAG: diaminopimelate epimerase [Chitinophagaceae bacterium]|jgi:diaminopimelate epimerase|nr:diaminopimelate epimerase [Chitinophagaceae bacterium]
MNISFSKYQGTGNDFILIDNRQKNISLSQEQIERLCHRRFGIGADGLMLLEEEEGYDFRMVYYNSDGREGSMCGNGGRCITKFAFDCGLHKDEYNFIAIDGPHVAIIESNGMIRLQMKDVSETESLVNMDFVDTGSPHIVKQVEEIQELDVISEGKHIRYNDRFAEQGVNVNFVKVLDECSIYVRTYERGVEDETFSCGTGVTASALLNAHNENGFNHIDVKTNGGDLYVEFEKTGEASFENIWLAGPAEKVFEGSILL